MKEKIKHQIRKVPKSPGIYVFKNKTGEFLYIGKAANLRNRVRQYLRKETYSPFLEHLLNEAEKVDFKTTDSEIEALILESKLIKEHQPKYNIMLRDDKQYFYVVFTDSTSSGQAEKFPKIFLTHQPFDSLRSLRASPKTEFIGPFTDGGALKATLRLLRRIFPYCTCKQKHHNFCLNYHIGKCLGFCCLKKLEIISKKLKIRNYKKNIKAIKDILSGKRKSLIKNLEGKMKGLGEKREFEEAIKLRNKIEKLKRVFENAKIIQDTIYQLDSKIDTSLENLKDIFKLPKMPHRIEGYDVSNIQGKNATGAMVVFKDGQPDKNEYRKFRIRFKKTPDDIAMLKEVLIRRLRHDEWLKPDLIFIDGGKGQLNAAINAIAVTTAFSETSKLKNLAIISLAKGKNEVFSTTLKKPVPIKKLPNQVKNLILQIDAEAHRFAIRYYRKLHRESVLPKTHF